MSSSSSSLWCDFVTLLSTIVRTLREDQPPRLLLNLLFYHLNHSEPTYKSQRIKLLDVIAACNQLNVNVQIRYRLKIFLVGDLTDLYLFESKFLVEAISAFRATHYSNIFLMFL